MARRSNLRYEIGIASLPRPLRPEARSDGTNNGVKMTVLALKYISQQKGEIPA